MVKKQINLALQGGGAHGAYTWGALDRLLEEEDLEISAISGTSAGALNGAALKAGMITGGRQGARDNLDWLWEKVSGVGESQLAGWMAPFGMAALSRAMEYSWQAAVSSAMTQVVSPYAFGSIYKNPLREIVEKFNYDLVCGPAAPHFFVSATKVRDGKIKVFEGDEIGPDALLASACLPTLFQAVEILDAKTGRSEAYWDGGYTGNPALFPLYTRELPPDIVIININPLEREDLPKTPMEIQNRINEISFNSSLLRELRAIDFVQRLLETGQIEEGQMNRVHIHMISDDDMMSKLSTATKTVPNPAVISALRVAGRASAEQFLRNDIDKVGKRSSIDLKKMFS
jgi:NTE family protein